MRRVSLIWVLFWSVTVWGGTPPPADSTQSDFDTARAIRITPQVASHLQLQFHHRQWDNFFPTLDLWIDSCGYHEPTLRTLMMYELIHQQPVDWAVSSYFDMGYYEQFYNRMQDAQESDYYNYYDINKTYYGYLPLRSPLDSILQKNAEELLETSQYQQDEELILMLFSGDIDLFESKSIKRKYRKSTIGRYMRNEFRKERDQYPGFLVGLGLMRQIGIAPQVGYAQTVRIGFSSPLAKRWLFDGFLSFRFPYRYDILNFVAMQQYFEVKPNVLSTAGFHLGYRSTQIPLTATRSLLIYPQAGLGVDWIYTSIYETFGVDEVKYYWPTTLYTALGISALIPIMKSTYLGAQINYHFIPYRWDARVLSYWDAHFFSFELFLRL
ncbi:MAG TPA: hypothetical protein GX007_07035 [Bacteroidales bacterium]|jgi:hypothetical protein|nr:hypothetical protein [Bacteroidales bacterium]